MMQIIAKTECCGCGACSQVCRHGCVSMREDEQGFLYPYVEKSLCIDCGLCGIVCPVLHQGESTPPLLTLASLNNKDNVREFSSSGGVFFSLAEKTIKEGGIVFGARFNEKWEVIHDYTDTLEGLFPLMGSKYVQSRVGDTYKEAKAFLQSGRKVLYSGTPCQILALKNFLNRDYENLLTVDVVCHGVPSPRVWRDYLKFILNEERRTVKRSCQSDDPVISEISFRNKKGGWRRFRLLINGSNTATYGGCDSANDSCDYKIVDEVHKKNIYMQGFLNNLFLRPSCHHCPSRSGKSMSDITLGDFWGISNFAPDYDDDKGTSLLLIRSVKGEEALKSVELTSVEVKYEDALQGNICIECDAVQSPLSERFWQEYPLSGIKCLEKIVDELRPSLVCLIYTKARNRIVRFAKKIVTKP